MRTHSHISIEDRLPTVHEFLEFDAGVAWDRLSPAEQRTLGKLAVKFGTIGECQEYFHSTLEEVRAGFMSGHWTPEAQETAVWSPEHVTISQVYAQNACDDLHGFFDEKVWARLWGWTPAVTIGLGIATIINASVTIGGAL